MCFSKNPLNRICFCIWFLISLQHNLQAQQPTANRVIDSIITVLPATMRSDEKAAVHMINVLEKLSKQQGHQHGQVQSLFFKAWFNYRHEPVDQVIYSIDSALKFVPNIAHDTLLVQFYILKGQCYVKKAQFSKALDDFTRAVKIAHARNDHANQTGALISIGWAYMENGKPTEAISFFNEVLRLNPLPDYSNRALLLCNIASCYNTILDFKKAVAYALQGIATARKKQSNTDLANGLNILARSYYQQGKMNKAIPFLKEAAEVRKKVADPSMLASDYIELADVYSKNNQPELAISWAKKAETICLENAITLKLVDTYETLASAYEKTGNYAKAFSYSQKLLAEKDSLSDDHYSQAFAQMQVQFETQKKEAENLKLKKENLEARLSVSNQQRWLIILASSVLLLLASTFYVTKLIKSRYATKLAVMQLAEQKRQIRAVMEAEEKERKRIAGELHDGVGQMLAAASLQLNKVRAGRVSIDKVDELILQTGKEVRNLSHQVTPELLLHHGLVHVLEQEVDRLNEAQDQTVFTLFTHTEQDELNELISLTIYRCFQELCSNILKHAKAGEVSIVLNLLTNAVELMVEDDGNGFISEGVASGLGLKNMQSRISLFDGEFSIDSTPGRGTTVIVKIVKPEGILQTV